MTVGLDGAGVATAVLGELGEGGLGLNIIGEVVASPAFLKAEGWGSGG